MIPAQVVNQVMTITQVTVKQITAETQGGGGGGCCCHKPAFMEMLEGATAAQKAPKPQPDLATENQNYQDLMNISEDMMELLSKFLDRKTDEKDPNDPFSFLSLMAGSGTPIF